MTPLRAGVLIGGESRRMGRPKHLVEEDGEVWLERIVQRLESVTPDVVLLGSGHVPSRLSALPRLPDAPGEQGPLAGILAAMRSDPTSAWLIAPCDVPHLTEEALRWLLSNRGPGVVATLPRRSTEGPVEPLLAVYEPGARPLLERLAVEGTWSLQGLADHPEVATPLLTTEVGGAWRDVDA